jgi:peptidylprolyl isomerase
LPALHQPERRFDDTEQADHMRQAAIGDTVRVHYTGTLDDGSEFDSSANRDPIEVTLGQSQVIPGFENALVGMSEGESKSFTLAAEDAYGPHHDELIHTIGRDQVPADVDLEVGFELSATDAEGRQMRLVVVDLSSENVTLDANHPLAGLALTFQLQLDGFVG